MQKNNKIKLITLLALTQLVACSGGAESSASDNSGNASNTKGDATQLTFIAPNMVPSLTERVSNGYIVVTNPTQSQISDIKYKLVDFTGKGNSIALDQVSTAACASIPAAGKCNIKLNIPANTIAGSVSILANNRDLFSSLTDKLVSDANNSTNLTNKPIIGVGQAIYTTTAGANGIKLYYHHTVIASVPSILVTGLVDSDNTGKFNNIVLIDGNNNPIPGQQIISSNLGAGASDLGLGNTFTILLPVPSSSDVTQTIKVKTEHLDANGTVSNSQISSNSSTLSTTRGVGIANIMSLS